jgi:cytochrome c-type biogenesis protein
MNTTDLSIGLAFIAGLASFLSPCVFSLVPVYIGYLSGQLMPESNDIPAPSNRKIQGLLHGTAFVLGFSVVFIALGAAASTLGNVLYDYRTTLSRIGGLAVTIFGLHVMGIITIPWLYYDSRPQYNLMGVFFSAGWSPCIGPVLGAMLTLALTSDGLAKGVQMLTSYSIGLAIPFLMASIAIDKVSHFYQKLGSKLRYLQTANGLLLIIIGILLFTGTLSLLTIRFSQLPILLELQQSIDSTIVNMWINLTD